MKSINRIEIQFQNSIRRGTGEAYLIISTYTEIDFSRYIIEASIYNWAYDGQCESSRAPYLYKIIEKSLNQETIRTAILDTLMSENEFTCNLAQLFDLARIYAQSGDALARAKMYERFLYKSNNSDWVGASEIIALDGIDGLLFIIDRVGAYLVQQENRDESAYLISHFQEHYPQIDVYAELNNAAIKNHNMQVYLDTIKETELQNQACKEEEKKKYGSVIKEIESKTYFISKYKELTVTELQEIADLFLSETKLEKKAKYLKIFVWHKYPYDITPLLLLAKGKTNKYRIKEYALEALKHITSPAVRELYLNKIASTTTPSRYTDLLLSNYEDDDCQTLCNIANKYQSEEIIEQLAISYILIFTKNKTPKCQFPLELLYNKMNCAIHRHDLVKILIDNNVLSEKLKDEIQFDCDEETRKLYLKLIEIQ